MTFSFNLRLRGTAGLQGPPNIGNGARETREKTRKLGGSHRGHGGHRGNIKIVRTPSAPNFTPTLKINSVPLCD
jgi:hypothetical protein